MKTSIDFLPERKQSDLRKIVEEIKLRLPQAQMVILYGSYARNEYVDYDQKVEFGIPTFFMSDYDILVVTNRVTDQKAERILEQVDQVYYKKPEMQPTVQFIHENIKRINDALNEGRYFYTQLKDEGILLYDSGKFSLSEPRELRFDEIKKQAVEYFNDKFESANEFLKITKMSAKEGMYKKTSFLLHQVCENAFQTIRLVFTLTNPKEHNLFKLYAYVRKYSEELRLVFPCKTVEDKRLFDLLKRAYIEARYNPKFEVTREDIEALLPKVELLLKITGDLCRNQILEYEKKVPKE